MGLGPKNDEKKLKIVVLARKALTLVGLEEADGRASTPWQERGQYGTTGASNTRDTNDLLVLQESL